MSEHRSSEFGTAMSGLVGVVILVALVYALTVAQFSGSGTVGTPEQIAARIAPVGSVTLAGAEPAAAPAVAAAPTAAEEGPGAAIYQKSCSACHAAGVAGAPKFGDKPAWEPRMALGLDQLVQTAIAGKGAMPPRGTCMDCTDEDLKLSIEHMLVQVGYEPAGSPAAAVPQDAGGMAGMRGMTGMEGISGMQGMGGTEGTSGMEGTPAAEPQPGMQ